MTGTTYISEIERRQEFRRTMGDDKVEFINGKIVESSPEFNKHSIVVDNLSFIFIRYVRKMKLGRVVGQKTMVSLKRNDFCPDISFFRKEVADTFIPDTLLFPVPDFVVEVLSENSEDRDRGVKFVDYALNGVKEYWLVDAHKKVVEQYFLENESFVLNEKVQHATVRCKVLEGLEIPLKAIFDEDANEAFLREI